MDRRERVRLAIQNRGRQPRNSEEEYYWWGSVADAAISAYEEALKEEGLVVVPREPTETMLEAAKRETFNPMRWQYSYTAMIEAWEKDNA